MHFAIYNLPNESASCVILTSLLNLTEGHSNILYSYYLQIYYSPGSQRLVINRKEEKQRNGPFFISKMIGCLLPSVLEV